MSYVEKTLHAATGATLPQQPEKERNSRHALFSQKQHVASFPVASANEQDMAVTPHQSGYHSQSKR
jgi:hypothetical protein